VNQLLDTTGFAFRLAKDGEDAGRMVAATPEHLDVLVESTLASSVGEQRDEIQHAVALMRARGRTRQDQRSAVLVLAGILERARSALSAVLLTKDEAALFQIANQFDLRHRRLDQRNDYDEPFLDWIFYWYLATVRLVNDLRGRESGAAGSSSTRPAAPASP
jgi:hypothetical protein